MVALALSVAALVFSIGILYVGLDAELGLFVLHRDIFGSVTASGSFTTVLTMWGVVCMTVLLNTFLAYVIYARNVFLARVLAFATTLIAFAFIAVSMAILAAN